MQENFLVWFQIKRQTKGYYFAPKGFTPAAKNLQQANPRLELIDNPELQILLRYSFWFYMGTDNRLFNSRQFKKTKRVIAKQTIESLNLQLTHTKLRFSIVFNNFLCPELIKFLPLNFGWPFSQSYVSTSIRKSLKIFLVSFEMSIRKNSNQTGRDV